MSVFPPVLLDTLSADASLWPGDLADARAASVKERLERAVEKLPPDVRDEVLDAITDPGRNGWARAALAGLTMAHTAGARPVGMAAPGCIRMEDAGGEAWALGVLGFEVEEHPAGAPSDVQRLTVALDQTFGQRRYVLYLRRAVPAGFDPGPIARAVHLWLGAIDRGEWQGQHAVYEDQDVALELILTGDKGKAGRNRLFTVGPITALERLAGVDAQLVRQAVTYQDDVADLPLTCVLGATQPWRMPRGYVEQLLYGTADFVQATGGPNPGYRAGFSANGRSLFSDPACRNLTSLWWVEPAGSPLAFRAWAQDNPWTAFPDRIPAVDGRRFTVVARDEVGARGRKSMVLAWRGPVEPGWELDP